MDYLYYILAVLVFGLICTCCVRFATGSSNRRALLEYVERQRQAGELLRARRAQRGNHGRRGGVNGKISQTAAVLEREIQHIRTPWGWPGHNAAVAEAGKPSLSKSVQTFADRLLREKQLASTRLADNLRINANVRALMEDRPGPARGNGMRAVYDQPVKRSLLRDPGEAHDQLDNLGTLEAERIRASLQRLTSMNDAVPARPREGEGFRYVAVADMKQPWGW